MATPPLKGTADQEPLLLSGGNPKIAKADGDAPVQAYIAAMPGWKRAVGDQIDRLIVGAVPTLRKAVKWNSPFYGVPEFGWFLSLHCFDRYIKVAFFNGAALVPALPVASKVANVGYLHLPEGQALDEARLTDWVLQASRLPAAAMERKAME